MKNTWLEVGSVFVGTLGDVAPIVVLLVFFQYIILGRPIRNLRKTVEGFIYVVLGLAFFLIGLDLALFPLGEVMAEQLSSPEFINAGEGGRLQWFDYYWIYLFAAAIGFATTIAEPSLIAVAMKANEMSGGAVSSRGLRIAVAIGMISP